MGRVKVASGERWWREEEGVVVVARKRVGWVGWYVVGV
jgi:hypothetical protein